MSDRPHTRNRFAFTTFFFLVMVALSFQVVPAGAAQPLDLTTAIADVAMQNISAVGATDHPKKKEEAPKETPKKDEKKDAAEKERLSVTRHSVFVGGRTINYRATAGMMPLKDESGKLKGHIFYTAYVADAPGGKEERPIAFIFNGGPGAASVWLHLGCLGPRRVLLSGKTLSPPYRWVDNEYTWLDNTDLVFVDPVGTGFSHHAEGVDPKDFYDVEEDIKWNAEFIRLYCTRNGRWLSPKFLIGESYGTTRVAGLSGYLQGKTTLNLNGVILISTALDFQTFSFNAGNDLPYALFLPAYAEAALYHRRLSPVLQANRVQTRNEVEKFALTDYLVSLAKGSSLPEGEREAIVEKLATYTGLDKTSIRNADLRISRGDFIRELLREKNQRLGLYDSRIVGDYRPTNFFEDPSIFELVGPLTAVWNQYVRKELEYLDDRPYEILSDKTSSAWKWGTSGQGYVNTASTLSRAVKENKSLKVFVASGYYDLTTPYFGGKYVVNHLGFDQNLLANITMEYYDAGHMMYTDMDSLKKLKGDVLRFFQGALQR
jgi:carboxypeptidase C (cathepsin A)